MKVGTDGVLLGAWCNIENCSTILDVGTGSGLIALMLAQRSEAQIDAVEIDEDAAQQATENVRNSPFRKRIRVINDSFQNYVEKSDVTYDLIVTNPPYFIRSLHSPNEKRTFARHGEKLPYTDIIDGSCSLLSTTGRLALILPCEQAMYIRQLAEKKKLFLQRQTIVYPTPKSNPNRILMEWTKEEKPCEETKLTIEITRHNYTEEFTKLTKDFYLDK